MSDFKTTSERNRRYSWGGAVALGFLFVAAFFIDHEKYGVGFVFGSFGIVTWIGLTIEGLMDTIRDENRKILDHLERIEARGAHRQ